MGRFSAIVFLLAACGDNNVVAPPLGVDPLGGVDGTAPGPVALPTQFAPQVCGELSWTTSTVNTALDVAVVPRAAGAQVLAVPLAGGAMTAYSLDKAMNLQTISSQLAINDAFTQVSASVVNGQLTATARDATSIRVNLLASDLSSAQQVAKLLPGYVSKPAFQSSDGVSFVPVADDQGLRLERFNGAWQVSTMRVATTDPATGVTAAPMDYSTVAAWATKSSCYMMTMFTASPGPLATMPEACTSPHLAIDSTTQVGQLVYESVDGIRIEMTKHTSFANASQLLRPEGTSPRILWDGHRFWISYLDQRGDIVVGYLDGGDTGHYVSAAIIGAKPVASAYELVLIGGQVWAVSFDAAGYSAHRMCIEPV